MPFAVAGSRTSNKTFKKKKPQWLWNCTTNIQVLRSLWDSLRILQFISLYEDLDLCRDKTEVALISHINGWKWISSITGRAITNLPNISSSAISIAHNLLSWTASLGALISFPAGMSQLQCLRVAFLQTHHETYFLLCFCCSPCPWPSSLTP